MTPQANIDQTLAALRRSTVTQLRQKHLEVFGEPTRAVNKIFLFKRIVWRIQSLTEGTLSERARHRAEELARDADLRTTTPRPPTIAPKGAPDASGDAVTGAATRTMTLPVRRTPSHDRLPIPGTILTRNYHGNPIEARVLPNGFEYQGQIYRSLSAVAKAVTGSHWNGHLFFGLTGPPEGKNHEQTRSQDGCH